MTDTLLIYGAYGYTGQLIVERAARAGLKPCIAGRDPDKTLALAKQYDLPHVAFDLSDSKALKQALKNRRVVLHCAGPFSATAAPMMEACIAAGAHYCDITGEIDVFALGHSLDAKARKAGVAIVPGVGFDVVPTDCLAAMLKEELPDATELILAFDAGGGPSRGTALTSVEGLRSGGRVRRDGKLVRVATGFRTRTFAFPKGERAAVTIPWGDVYTAFVSTGIPNIEVYMAMPPRLIAMQRRLRLFAPLLALPPAQWALKQLVKSRISGPDDTRRQGTDAQVYGEVRNSKGEVRKGTLVTPNGYDHTADAALAIARHLHDDSTAHAGFYTPSLLMGAGFVKQLPGVKATLWT